MKPTWILGCLALAALAAAVFLIDLPTLFYPHLPFIRFFQRCLYILLIAGVLCLFRIIRGPTAADRAVAIDILGILVIGICALLGIPTGRGWYIDIGIAWALQNFIGTLALAKYLERRRLDE